MKKNEIKAIVSKIMSDYGFIETEIIRVSIFGPICLYCTAKYYYEADEDKEVSFQCFFCIANNKIVLYKPLHVFFTAGAREVKDFLVEKIEYYEQQAKEAFQAIVEAMRSKNIKVFFDEEFNW